MKYYLSVTAIVQNEAPYIADWIEYHESLGVEHFYIYENDSTDDTMNELMSFSDSLITVQKMPGKQKQLEAMMHSLTTFREATRWLALIDVDEYIVPMRTDNIQFVLKDYEEYAALCPHWVLFGSNGYKKFSPQPVVERFTSRAKETNLHVKSIVDPKRTKDWVTVHKFTHPGSFAVDENKVRIEERDSRPENATESIIRINHYVTKSFDECAERRGRMRADISAYHEMPGFFEAHDVNEVTDTRALDLWKDKM
jgi:hypothetical protein